MSWRLLLTMGTIILTAMCVGGCATTRNIVTETTPLDPPQGKTLRWSFDGGGLPENWTTAETQGRGRPASWTVQKDGEASSSPAVLKLNTSNTGGTFNLCIVDQPKAADVDLSVKVRADSGREDQGGGLVWRYRDPSNYYVARWNPLEANYALYKVAGNKRTLLTEVSASDKASAWTTLRAVQVKDRIDCYIDDKRVIAVKDGALTGAGKVGLWSKADASSSFDDLKVTFAE